MLNVYKRCEKSASNPSGIVELSTPSEIDKPFLLCVSAQDNQDKSIYGMIREGARAARVYTTQEMAAGFKIDEVPIDFLGIRFKRDNKYKENYEELVDNFLYPYLIGDGKRSVEEIQKLARRINLMTYCDGTLTYKRCEKRLEEKLLEVGLSHEEVESILSQISLVAVATMVDTRDIKATTVTFIDVNDLEISTNRTNHFQKMLQDQNRRSIYGYGGKKSNIIYVYDGSGCHSVKEYLLDDRIVKPALCSVVSNFLENSISNEGVEELLPISLSSPITKLKEYARDDKSPKSLLDQLDQRISYNSSPRYSPEEANMRMELDASYKELFNMQKRLIYTEEARKNKESKLNTVIDGIKKYSSDVTFWQILVEAGLWQATKGVDIYQEKSDREIRELYSALDLDEEKLGSGPKL